jgi:CheY-like chemotaxis protein
MLSDEGHTVDVASTGTEALARFREAHAAGIPYSLVITDHGMPGMTGRELGRAVKDASPDTPVILVTGWGALSREDTADDRSVDEIVSKPPRLKRMREAMARVLARS